jgi:hypothetical protein
MTNTPHRKTGQPDGQHPNTHPRDHLPQRVHTTPLHTTRTLPHSPTTCTRRTHHPRTPNHRPVRAQGLAPLCTQHPTPNIIPNRYDRHCQRYFDPDAAFQHLCQHTLDTTPTDQPYCIALDGTAVPRTGTSIPGAHGALNPAHAPFARGLRQAQRFVMAGWLGDDPNARCGPVCWLPIFSPNAPLCPPHLAPFRNPRLDCQPAAGARVARRGRARRATAAVRGRRAG